MLPSIPDRLRCGDRRLVRGLQLRIAGAVVLRPCRSGMVLRPN